MPPFNLLAPLGVLVAGIYCRISDDVEGLRLGVARQEEDGRRVADRIGAGLHRVYTDNDLGASTRSRAKRRPEFDQLIADVRAGIINVIIYYSSSRLTRRPLEYEMIIKLVEETGVQLHTVVSGTVDLTTADGRLVGRILAAADAAEAERISERLKRKFTQRRAGGLPHGGGHITGWLKPDPLKGIGYCTHLDPVAVYFVEQAAQWLMLGKTMTAVTNRWNAEGFRTIAGNPWTLGSAQTLLSSPRLAGLVFYGDEIIGTGDYPAVLDPLVWQAIQPFVKPLGKRTGHDGGRKFLLSGWMKCGLCLCNMRAYPSTHNTPSYMCVKLQTVGQCGKTSRSMEWLESTVRGYVGERIRLDIDELEVPEEMAALDTSADIEALEARVREVRDAASRGVMGMLDAGEILTSIRSQIEERRGAQNDAVADRARRMIPPDILLRTWDDTSLDTLGERRMILGRYVDRVEIRPLGKGRYHSEAARLAAIDIIPSAA